MQSGVICFLELVYGMTLCATLASCSALNIGSETPQQQAGRLEPMLSAAGFQMVPADTPDKMTHLRTLPALKMNYYINKQGTPRYWFADPDYCHCLYWGTETAYQKYQDLQLQAAIVENEQQAAQERYESAQQMNMDPLMGGFGFGPGIGFSF